MLTRRTFLSTLAAAPLAKFCKTEPARPYAFRHNVISIEEAERRFALKPGTLRMRAYPPDVIEAIDKVMLSHGYRTSMVPYGYALPQGTLG